MFYMENELYTSKSGHGGGKSTLMRQQFNIEVTLTGYKSSIKVMRIFKAERALHSAA
jgi:hypothetical protein